MDFKHRVERSFKPRFAVIYPFGLFFAIFGSVTDQSLRTAVGYIIAGLLIRLWSNGYAIKNDKLTTSGPYAFVRNPLYVGTFLTAIGFMFLLRFENFAMPVEITIKLLFLFGLCFMYFKTIKNEQGMLSAKFGKAYEAYCAKVPAMIPTLKPYAEGEKWPFSLDRLIFSKEYKSIFWITIIIIVFHLKTRLLLEHKAMTERTWGLVLLAAALIIVDILFEMTKKKRAK